MHHVSKVKKSNQIHRSQSKCPCRPGTPQAPAQAFRFLARSKVGMGWSLTDGPVFSFVAKVRLLQATASTSCFWAFTFAAFAGGGPASREFQGAAPSLGPRVSVSCRFVSPKPNHPGADKHTPDSTRFLHQPLLCSRLPPKERKEL